MGCHPIDVIFKEKIAAVFEDKKYFYVLPDTKDQYDHLTWKVDKQSRKVEYFDYLDFLEILDSTSQLSVDEFKRAATL